MSTRHRHSWRRSRSPGSRSKTPWPTAKPPVTTTTAVRQLSMHKVSNGRPWPTWTLGRAPYHLKQFAGAAVAVNYSSSKEGADRVVADIKSKGGKAIAVKGDVAKTGDVRQLFDETKKAFGTLDVLVNNAGVYKFVPLEEITEDEFHREFNINLLGTILATKEALKHFGPNGGSVINMSSIASAGVAEAPGYSRTKSAGDAPPEVGPRKILVHAIAPGSVCTAGMHSGGSMGSDFEKTMVASTPLGRIGQPDDIARIAVFLASDDSAWLTGERLTASGGYR